MRTCGLLYQARRTEKCTLQSLLLEYLGAYGHRWDGAPQHNVVLPYPYTNWLGSEGVGQCVGRRGMAYP